MDKNLPERHHAFQQSFLGSHSVLTNSFRSKQFDGRNNYSKGKPISTQKVKDNIKHTLMELGGINDKFNIG